MLNLWILRFPSLVAASSFELSYDSFLLRLGLYNGIGPPVPSPEGFPIFKTEELSFYGLHPGTAAVKVETCGEGY